MRRLLAVATVLTALVSLSPQVSALFLLAPAEFGQFSMLYLIYGFGASVGLSVISEAWHRVILDEQESLDWREYATASLTLSFLATLVAFGTGLLLQLEPLTSGIGAVGSGLAVYRSTARFFLAQRQQWSKIIIAELAFITAFGVVLGGALIAGLQPIDAVCAAWLAAGLGMLVTSRPGVPLLAHVRAWLICHRSHIPRLLGDSLLMDVGAIFTPMLLAPILGLQAFGTYRAVSNVAAPVRLVLNPLRPQIAHSRRGDNRSTRIIAAAIIAGLLMGLGAGVILVWIGTASIDIGVLSSLSPFWLAVVLSVGSNFVGHFFYIRARTSANGRRLISARVTQTLLVTFLPLGCAWAGALPGAIWGLAVAGVLTAITWAIADRPSSSSGRTTRLP